MEFETEYGTTHVAELFSRVRIGLQFRAVDEADAIVLRNLQRVLKRNLTPLLIAPDSAGTDAWFCRIASNLEQRIDIYRDLSFEFLEESRGRTIAV